MTTRKKEPSKELPKLEPCKPGDLQPWNPGDLKPWTGESLEGEGPELEPWTPDAVQPIVGAEGERRGNVKDVAEWMFNELKKAGALYQSNAARSIIQHFGGGFIYRNRNDNYAIDHDVLEHFRTITEKTVVWVKRERFWRWRQESDPTGTRAL
jgi:hypothetical protein